jgi:hypothetical protein
MVESVSHNRCPKIPAYLNEKQLTGDFQELIESYQRPDPHRDTGYQPESVDSAPVTHGHREQQDDIADSPWLRIPTQMISSRIMLFEERSCVVTIAEGSFILNR